ncbi:MAG TPA: hypothetical protein VJL29_11540 [Thermoguttaceae bacterium]|nr:hypothetical protein [Thermoguttaceae bacterium]
MDFSPSETPHDPPTDEPRPPRFRYDGSHAQPPRPMFARLDDVLPPDGEEE